MPTNDRALRAAKAVCHYEDSEQLGSYAALIDREAGIGELQEQFSKAYHDSCAFEQAMDAAVAERDELRRRLDAVVALHCEEGQCKRCGLPGPCPTVRAARGEG